jgi:hypothetical protein
MKKFTNPSLSAGFMSILYKIEQNIFSDELQDFRKVKEIVIGE